MPQVCVIFCVRIEKFLMDVSFPKVTYIWRWWQMEGTWVWNIAGIIITDKNQSIRRTNFPSNIVPTTSSAETGRSNSGFCGRSPVTILVFDEVLLSDAADCWDYIRLVTDERINIEQRLIYTHKGTRNYSPSAALCKKNLACVCLEMIPGVRAMRDQRLTAWVMIRSLTHF
jgi:hypothetical protein